MAPDFDEPLAEFEYDRDDHREIDGW